MSKYVTVSTTNTWDTRYVTVSNTWAIKDTLQSTHCALEDKPTKQRWIDDAGYDVTSANNKRNHLRWLWSKHMIWRELRRYDNGMQLHTGQFSVTTASAAFLQFDWKLLRQFPIMRGMRLLASVVTPRSYSILSGTGCISSILLKVASFQLWKALFGPPSHMPVRAKSTNIHIWCRIVRLLIL